MKILFIEDDDEKRKKIVDFLSKEYSTMELTTKFAYHSGLLELVSKTNYDLVLMDMSMPSFDISLDNPDGGSPESFAGRKLLEQMKFRNINFPTIIITQFDSFGKYSDKLSLEELKHEMKQKYSPIYRCTIYYHSSENTWQELLKKEINDLQGLFND